MSEKYSAKSNNVFDQKRVFNLQSSDMPSLVPAAKRSKKNEFSEQELEALCKNPRESAELIRYLIEFIKSL